MADCKFHQISYQVLDLVVFVLDQRFDAVFVDHSRVHHQLWDSLPGNVRSQSSAHHEPDSGHHLEAILADVWRTILRRCR